MIFSTFSPPFTRDRYVLKTATERRRRATALVGLVQSVAWARGFVSGLLVDASGRCGNAAQGVFLGALHCGRCRPMCCAEELSFRLPVEFHRSR